MDNDELMLAPEVLDEVSKRLLVENIADLDDRDAAKAVAVSMMEILPEVVPEFQEKPIDEIAAVSGVNACSVVSVLRNGYKFATGEVAEEVVAQKVAEMASAAVANIPVAMESVIESVVPAAAAVMPVVEEVVVAMAPKIQERILPGIQVVVHEVKEFAEMAVETVCNVGRKLVNAFCSLFA